MLFRTISSKSLHHSCKYFLIYFIIDTVSMLNMKANQASVDVDAHGVIISCDFTSPPLVCELRSLTSSFFPTLAFYPLLDWHPACERGGALNVVPNGNVPFYGIRWALLSRPSEWMQMHTQAVYALLALPVWRLSLCLRSFQLLETVNGGVW